MTVTITLDAQLASGVDSLVRSGRFGSGAEVLNEGVRLVLDREAKLAELDAAIQRGLDDADAGRSEDAEVVFDRLRRKFEAML